MRQEDLAIVRKAFDAWRAAQYGSVAKQQILKRAVAKMMRLRLAKAFFSWKDKLHLVDHNLAMKRKVGGRCVPLGILLKPCGRAGVRA